ncbi:hypothetical protein [Candidatus Hepatobacter penaei]|uniref:hypothetical protein n=1 Tax=Candidatus Hepatobacter penaei TaxID=1274402 RepID=UPI0012E0AD2C|nr:hypothetical protein [Candidatus Hepatobacter penaei]
MMPHITCFFWIFCMGACGPLVADGVSLYRVAWFGGHTTHYGKGHISTRHPTAKSEAQKRREAVYQAVEKELAARVAREQAAHKPISQGVHEDIAKAKAAWARQAQKKQKSMTSRHKHAKKTK